MECKDEGTANLEAAETGPKLKNREEMRDGFLPGASRGSIALCDLYFLAFVALTLAQLC